LCSEVPGLQVENRETKEWIPVETLYTPKNDLFCIMGRKMEIFAAANKGLPYNKERYSILFFADVPS